MKKELAKFLSFDEVVRNAKSIAEMLMKERKHGYVRSWLEKFGECIGIVQELVELLFLDKRVKFTTDSNYKYD